MWNRIDIKNALTMRLVLAMALVSSYAGAESAITLKKQDTQLDIRIDNAPFATYVWQDDAISRPYFKNLHAPNGIQVTRTYPLDPVKDADNDDHSTYHPGLWLAFGDLSGADHWRLKVLVKHLKFLEKPHTGNDSATFVVHNLYEDEDGQPLCYEVCRYTILVRPWGTLMTQESQFHNPNKDFYFGDQEEMGLGLRLATDLRVKKAGGNLLNSHGGKDESGTWGKTADWCAGYKRMGDTYVGAAILPHPENLRPSWYHSRDYGLIVANPFSEKAMTGPKDPDVAPMKSEVKRGDSMHLRFGVAFFNHAEAPDTLMETIQQDYLSLDSPVRP